jgi:Bacteriocin-protection, YdeI or OmpD-Associated
MAAKKKSLAYTYSFSAPLEVLDFGRMKYWVVRLPLTFRRQVPFSNQRVVRMRGKIADQAVSLAWTLSGPTHYVLVSKALARAAKIAIGDSVQIAFNIVASDEIIVPAEVAEALRQEPEWQQAWDALTPGARRGLCHMVDKLKDEEKRAMRAINILESVQRGDHPRAKRRLA